MSNHINEISILVNLTIKIASLIKVDKTLRDAVASDTNGSESAFRVHKKLCDSEYLKQMTSIRTKAGNVLRQYSFAWDDPEVESYEYADSNSEYKTGRVQRAGSRMVIASVYEELLQPKLAQYKIDFDKAREAFFKRYPRYIDEARIRLGSAFYHDDFPEIELLEHKCFFDFYEESVPTMTTDPRLKISDDLRSKIERNAKMKERKIVRTAIESFIGSIVEQGKNLSANVKAMNDKEQKKFFKVSSFDAFAESVDLIPEYNKSLFGNRSDLTRAYTEIKGLLTSINDVSSLRGTKDDAKTKRDNFAKGLDKALDPLNDSFFNKLGGKDGTD